MPEYGNISNLGVISGVIGEFNLTVVYGFLFYGSIFEELASPKREGRCRGHNLPKSGDPVTIRIYRLALT